MKDEQWEYVWCYFRNLTHTIYREIRHIGPPMDYAAKCLIDEDDPYFDAARKCQKNRRRLKSSVPFQAVTINDTDAIIAAYQELSGLTPEEVLDIFMNYRWQSSYGGSKWGDITMQFLALKEAIDAGDLEKALAVCERIRHLSHNSGRLVPAKQDWERNRWLQEKWPIWCDGG